MASESRGTAVIWVVAAVLGVLALMRLTGSGGEEEHGEPMRIDRSEGTAAGATGDGSGGSRVAAAVAEAGGPTRKADLTGVNLAAHAEDGQQVVVPAAGTVPGAVAPGATAETPTIKPSLGSATVEQLDEIDGIGPTLAERIVEYRTENGGFSSLDELQDVDGIGEKRLETLSEALQP